MNNKKKQYIIIGVIVAILLVGTVIFFAASSSWSQRGVIVEIPSGIGSDSGRKIVIKDSLGIERTVTTGGVFALNERCGTLEGRLAVGAKIEYRLLPGNKFCVYDTHTTLDDVYIRVVSE